MTTVRKNERSWAIELISQVNQYCRDYDLIIKRAGGETTINEGLGINMFPDVVLYADNNLSAILQGWELKMPDVKIDNEAFVLDAQRKAKALHLNSCVIWNFTYAKLFIFDECSSQFREEKIWTNQKIKTRGDVSLYKSEWVKTLRNVLDSVNSFLLSGDIKRISISEVLTNTSLSRIVNENKNLVADYLSKSTSHDALLEAHISAWWEEYKSEYEGDEIDMYQAYAKSIIINWTNRILFAHLIKGKQKAAYAIDKLDYLYSAIEANKLFEDISEKCDFYNIFAALPYNEYLPSITWNVFIELSLFLKNTLISSISQTLLQQVLENTVNISKRAVNGQFTTPITLARILSRITIHDMTEDCFDCCCGTGTISSSIIELKKKHMETSKAILTTWASDKFQLPLQIANLSMTSYDSMDIPCMLFKKDILMLHVGNEVQIVNPRSGEKEIFKIPQFHAIVSNLPFVNSRQIPDADKGIIRNIGNRYQLTKRADYSYYIALHLDSLVKEGGYVGLILSNSFLGTEAGVKFVDAVRDCYDDIRIHISGKGRWFSNADVVTALLVMRKRTGKEQNNSVSFFTWKKSLSNIEVNKGYEDSIVNSSLLDKDVNSEVLTRVNYKHYEIEKLKNYKVSYNAMFTDLKWLLDIAYCLIPLKDIMYVFRGNRRGWDKLFFPEKCENIEAQFLKEVLVNAKGTAFYIAVPDRKAFCCDMELCELVEKGYIGAYSWIKKFENQKNGVGKPLPDVLAKNGMKWYELRTDEMAEFFTMMNPDNRLYYGRFMSPTFINQRLIGLKRKNPNDDPVLLHALLNSALSLFYIEAVGFGRGLGVLDINKDSISNCYILNPLLLSEEDKEEIKCKFSRIMDRKILDVDKELVDPLRKEFDLSVLRAYGVSEYYDMIVGSLKSLRNIRNAVKKKRVKMSLPSNYEDMKDYSRERKYSLVAERPR